MRKIIEYIILAFALLLASISAAAQTDRREVRSGNRQFRKENFTRAEIDYRKALVKDSSSFAASYDLANSLYRQNNFEEAGKTLEKVKDSAPMNPNSSDYYYNLGNVACQKKDWQAAVDAYKQSLLRNPADVDAKENYIYAKLMLKNQGGGGNDKNNQNQDQNQQNQNQNQQNQNQNQQNQDQNQNQNQNQNQQNQQQGQQGQGKISPQQAQQMLSAIQAKEKETQDKVNKEKAALLKSKQKEKNW
ncbi:MAG: tetratricopeptide repeat protein [Candidatus Cryptobacteroides sp.]|nr:tetratricopeptide repeat protein [Candidatus Cryptobacteroides sp.]MEE3429595.1 tetratricopeptide repeat protein [Candidatus Cryptobacteroides sp.]